MKKVQFKKRKIDKKYLVILAVFVGAAVLLGVSIGISLGASGGTLPAWITAVAVILLVALPLLLLALLFAVLGDKKAAQQGSENGAKQEKEPAQPESAPAPAKRGGQRTRFDGLTRIDGRREMFAGECFEDAVSLPDLCREFRNFAAGRLGVSHIMILQGMSGTGKTSLAYAFGEYLGNPSTVIPVQPMWKERTDLIGYYNEFTKRFNETDLLKKMYEANYSGKIYITVLDEMNIARVEYYFAEFLSLLELPEADKRNLAVVSDEWLSDPKRLDDGPIRLPGNMWFIGYAGGAVPRGERESPRAERTAVCRARGGRKAGIRAYRAQSPPAEAVRRIPDGKMQDYLRQQNYEADIRICRRLRRVRRRGAGRARRYFGEKGDAEAEHAKPRIHQKHRRWFLQIPRRFVRRGEYAPLQGVHAPSGK